jgi:effector-binding domain-containing protein
MAPYEIQSDTTAEQPTATASTTGAIDDIGTWLAKAYDAVAGVLARQQVSPTGPPFARFRQLRGGRFAVEAGFPVARAIDPSGEVGASSLPPGPVARTMHIGPYEDMEPAYDALVAWIRGRHGEPEGDAWEIYYSDPTEEPDPTTWRTEIVQPYRVDRSDAGA